MQSVFNTIRQTGYQTKRNDFLNEAVYFGKTPEALKLESLIGELKEDVTKNFMKFNDVVDLSATTLKIIRKIEQHLEYMFNAEEVIINLGIASRTIRSYIKITDFYLMDILKSRTITDKNGVKFRSSRGKTLIIDIGVGDLLKNAPAEVTAVVIHEVGHSMYQSISGRIIYSIPFLFVGVFATLFIFIASKMNDVEFIKRISIAGNKIFSEILTYISKIVEPYLRPVKFLSIFQAFKKQEVEIGGVMVDVTTQNIINGAIAAFTGYDEEKFSDNLATSYGYGSEMSNFLNKLETKPIVESKEETYAYHSAVFFLDMVVYSVNQILYPHPSDMDRVLNQLNYLKQAKKEAKNPKMIRIIDEDIKAIEKLVKEVKKDDTNYWFNKMNLEWKEKGINLDMREIVSTLDIDKSSALSDYTKK